VNYIVQMQDDRYRDTWMDVQHYATTSDAESDMREFARDEPDHDHRIITVVSESEALSRRVSEEEL
jgi:hypothetical protein